MTPSDTQFIAHVLRGLAPPADKRRLGEIAEDGVSREQAALDAEAQRRILDGEPEAQRRSRGRELAH